MLIPGGYDGDVHFLTSIVLVMIGKVQELSGRDEDAMEPEPLPQVNEILYEEEDTSKDLPH